MKQSNNIPVAGLDIVVLGLGRFGCLWAKYMTQLGMVQGYDPFVHYIPMPARENITLLSDMESLYRVVQNCDVLFFCVPISTLEKVLTQLQPALVNRWRNNSKPLWLMDTCSVKILPMAWLKQAIQNIYNIEKLDTRAFYILGLHPMFGPDSGAESIEGFPIVLCPNDLQEKDLFFWQQCFKALGLDIITMSADEHDYEAARTQGLTHLLGRILERLDIRPSPIATAGYQALCQLREQTCHDTWELFLDLQQQNNYTLEMRWELQKSLVHIYNELDRGYLHE